jgi:hypothetical protein
MKFFDWILGRTAGNLAGNAAYYSERKRQASQLGAETGDSEQKRLLVAELTQDYLEYQKNGGKNDLPTWFHAELERRAARPMVETKEALRKLAIEKYGPVDPEMEASAIRFLKTIDKLLDFFETAVTLKKTEIARCSEIIHMMLSFSQNEEINRHIKRVDLRDALAGLTTSNGELVNKILRRIDSIWNNQFPNPKQLAPHPNQSIACTAVWCNEATSHINFDDVCFAMKEGHPEPLRRNKFCLELDWNRYAVERKTGVCSDCGGIVSLKATSCPHCGNPDPF